MVNPKFIPTILISNGLTWHILVEPILHLCDHHSGIHLIRRDRFLIPEFSPSGLAR